MKHTEVRHPPIHGREEMDLKAAKAGPGKAIHTPLLAREHMLWSPPPPPEKVDKFTDGTFRGNAAMEASSSGSKLRR